MTYKQSNLTLKNKLQQIELVNFLTKYKNKFSHQINNDTLFHCYFKNGYLVKIECVNYQLNWQVFEYENYDFDDDITLYEILNDLS